jgi:type VI secretion system protein ImpG
MSETLYTYYERELLFIRQMAQEFAKQYPAAAGRLLLEPGRSVDPHIERLIEAFALLAARVQYKLDDEFPELTDALLGVLYPHYLAPVPSVGVVQFVPDPAQSALKKGFPIARESLLRTQPVAELNCRFRTGYPVTLWPLGVSAASLQPPPFPAGLRPPPQTAALLRVQLEALGGTSFAELSLDRLRFFLNGESQVTAQLFELIFNHATQILVRPADGGAGAAFTLDARQCLHPVGFEPDEALLPYPRRSFPGYGLLTEFFAFRNKFLFVDLEGLRPCCGPEFGRKAEVLVFLNRHIPAAAQGVEAGTFLLGCTPAVNLFEHVTEPINLTRAQHEYLVIPDVSHPLGMEIHSIESVTGVDPTREANVEYLPLYSYRHGSTPANQKTFWHLSRRPSSRANDRATDVYLSLVDQEFQPRLPEEKALVVRALCTNRELPLQLRQAGERLTWQLEAGGPVKRIHSAVVPSPPLLPPSRRGARWRLISHLVLNHLSLADGEEGRDALREILGLYEFTDSEAAEQRAAVLRQLIDGITAVSGRRVVGRPPTAAGGFCRGVEVTVELDEDKFVGTGAYLFACVLERFLGLYCSVNSFSQLVARSRQAEGVMKKWPPRAGLQVLL